jgi:hypothetical protein
MFTLLKHVHGHEVSAVLLYEEEVDWSYAQKSPSMSRHIATGIFKTTGLSIPCTEGQPLGKGYASKKSRDKILDIKRLAVQAE